MLEDFGFINSTYASCDGFRRNIPYSNSYNYYYETQNFEILTLKEFESKNSRYKKEFKRIIKSSYFKRFRKDYIGFDEILGFKVLIKSLEVFKDVFEEYILLIIDTLEPKISFASFLKSDSTIESVFSFNYSSTFQRFYEDSNLVTLGNIKHLHGKAEDKNIVLGISDLDDNLRRYKIFSFVKTYQKLINKTDYLFLDEPSVRDIQFKESIFKNLKLKYNIVVWGHSLDISDEE